MKRNGFIAALVCGLALVFASCDFLGTGEKSYSVEFYSGGSLVKKVEVPEGEKVSSVWEDVNSFNDEEHSGFYFAGWCIKSDKSKFTDECIYSNKIYYAVWQTLVKVHYYDSSYGDWVISSYYLDEGKTLNFYPSSYYDEQKKYEFNYWSEDKDSTVSERSLKEKTTFGEKSPVDVYAVYSDENIIKLSASDQEVDVSFSAFSKSSSYATYTVKITDTVDNTSWENNVYRVKRNSIGKCIFPKVKNGHAYTASVTEKTFGACVESVETVTPNLEKETVDWIVAMYLDGDNNLNDAIWYDLNEMEYGLSSTKGSVKAVALWDGYTMTAADSNSSNEDAIKTNVGKSGTYLFELGSDNYGIEGTYASYSESVSSSVIYSAKNLDSSTRNLSHTADWLVSSDKTPDDLKNVNCGEVNMGSKETLVNFLNWVNDHYTANKGVILQFSDHGGGARAGGYVILPDGQTVNMNGGEKRALCWDEGSASSFLKTQDVSDALAAAGYGSDNKLSMIIMDVCLGATLEDSYQFRNYAEYLAASPNNIPGLGLNYTAFAKSFTSTATIESIANSLVNDYITNYRGQLWNSIAESATGTSSWSNLSSDQKIACNWWGLAGIPTFSVIDLSKVDAVKEKVNALAEVLLSDDAKAKKIIVDSDGYEVAASGTNTSEASYVKYLGSKFCDYYSQGYINNSMSYMGTYTWLYDLGYMMDLMKTASASKFSSNTNENAWSDLYDACNAVQTALGDAVKYSWRDAMFDTKSSKLTISSVNLLNNYGLYYYLDEGESTADHYYGLTVCGSTIAVNGGKLAEGSCPDFYKTDLMFGQDSKWGDLLEYWFGE